jgi:serpin B
MKIRQLMAGQWIAFQLTLAVTLASTLSAANQSAAPTTPANVTTLVQANNALAFDLYAQFKPGMGDNAFFSPYSISTALGMTWAGAQGDTATQMAQALHFDELPAGQTVPAFEYLGKALATVEKKSGVQLELANSLWPQKGFKILPEYLKLVQAGFDSVITPVDYQKASGPVRQQINTWVANKTNQRIKDLLSPMDVTASTKLVLVNAIYFKGNWAEKFDAKAT